MAYQVDMGPLERSGIRQANMLQGLGQTIGSTLGGINRRGKQEEQQAKMQQLMQAAASGDKQAIDMLYSINPEAVVAMEKRNQTKSDNRFKTPKAFATAKLIEKMSYMDEAQATAAFNAAVQSPDYDIDESDRPLFLNRESQRAAVQKVMGEDYANNVFGESVSDTQASLPAEAIAFNDLIKDFTPKQQKIAKQIKAGLKGRAVSNAELTAIQSGEIDDYGKWKVEQKQAEKFASMTGSSRATAIDKGFDKIKKIDTGIGNIDAAIAAVGKGAGVGAIESKFPSIRAASVELDNIRGSMALDIVGATTFGALSESELNFAKDVALPTGLSGPKLIEYLKTKKSGQEKLRAYYNEQIQFLDQGGTVAGFMRMKKRGQAGSNTAVNNPPELLARPSNTTAKVVKWEDLPE